MIRLNCDPRPDPGRSPQTPVWSIHSLGLTPRSRGVAPPRRRETNLSGNDGLIVF